MMSLAVSILKNLEGAIAKGYDINLRYDFVLFINENEIVTRLKQLDWFKFVQINKKHR